MLFLIFLAACVAAAATGMIFQPGSWYDGLAKPDWTPPRWAFPVVWTALYILIAVAATFVAGLPGAEYALAIWALQIALNTLWTPVFFGGHHIRAGLIVIAALWLTAVAMVVVFWRLDWIAGLILLPYLVWLSLATALNFWIWRHNSQAS